MLHTSSPAGRGIQRAKKKKKNKKTKTKKTNKKQKKNTQNEHTGARNDKTVDKIGNEGLAQVHMA